MFTVSQYGLFHIRLKWKKKIIDEMGQGDTYNTHQAKIISSSLLLWTFSTSAQKKTTQHEIPGFALQPVVQGTKGVDWQTGISEVERLGDGVEEGGKNRVLGFHKWKVRFERIKRGSALIRRVWNVCMYITRGSQELKYSVFFYPVANIATQQRHCWKKISSHGLLDIAWSQVRCKNNSDM